MQMIKVHRCNQAVTPFSQQLLDLAAMLSIDTYYLHSKSQYMCLGFLHPPSVQMTISCQRYLHKNDVVISSEVFTEILIDVASGTLINDAMLKQGSLITY